MIDLHLHVLPGVDDGPETLDESIEMCRLAAADGIEAGRIIGSRSMCQVVLNTKKLIFQP